MIMNHTWNYTWISSKGQAGSETDEGQWHMKPHPHLTQQFKGDKGKATEHMYWHPDYVIFKSNDKWYVDQRTSKHIEGSFETKPDAKAWAIKN